MRVLILTLGSRGDVQPYVALGAVLRERGHAVTLATGQGFDDLITGHGLASAPLSIDVQAMMQRPEIRAAMTSVRGRIKAFRTAGELVRRQLDDMWALVQASSPELIVYHPKAFIAPYLARAIGAVAAPSFLQPAFVPTGAFPHPLARLPRLGSAGNRLAGKAMLAMIRLSYRTMLRKWLPEHREVADQPSLDPIRGYHPVGLPVPRLHAHSRHLVPKPRDWSPDDHVTGYWFLPPSQAHMESPELDHFLASGSAPIYVGFGSMPSIDADGLALAVAEALENTGIRAVVATGWGALGEAAATEAVHVIAGAAHDVLFPRCSAVVHHGGAGTTHEGLRWGRPTLVCPLFGDQPFWGRIVNEAGAGPAPLPLKRLDRHRLSAAMRALQSGAFQQTAEALGERIRSEPGTAAAADLIEALDVPGG